MLQITKYAAIDIGSNAIRLLVSNVIEDKNKEPQFKKSALVRVPIRLGTDVFIKGTISPENTQRMIDAMNAFKLLMKVHGVSKYKACATSAMREAENGQETASKIFSETGIKIDIIDGKKEAAAAAVPDQLGDDVALIGPRGRIREQLQPWKEAGKKRHVDTMLIGTQSIDTMRFLAEEML